MNVIDETQVLNACQVIDKPIDVVFGPFLGHGYQQALAEFGTELM